MRGATFEELTSAWSSSPPEQRLATFHALPPELEERTWALLALECERERRSFLRDPLDEPPVPRVPKRPRVPRPVTFDTGRCATHGVVMDDPLLAIPPPVFVERLADVEVPRSGMVHCPLPGHDERTPSCKVYDDPERGFYCFGCHRGGTIYDFGAALWEMPTRGPAFNSLRQSLARELLREVA